MAYVRKTRDVYFVQGNYGCGWETVTTEVTKAEALANLKCYDENEPYPHRIKRGREKLTDAGIWWEL